MKIKEGLFFQGYKIEKILTDSTNLVFIGSKNGKRYFVKFVKKFIEIEITDLISDIVKL